jgi:hypothetical protein
MAFPLLPLLLGGALGVGGYQANKAATQGRQDAGFLGNLFGGTAFGQAMLGNQGVLPEQKMQQQGLDLRREELDLAQQVHALNAQTKAQQIDPQQKWHRENQRWTTEQTGKLRGEASGALASFNTLQDATKDIMQLTRGSTAVDTTAAITKLAKALDPESVVRSSETETIIESQSLPGHIKSAMNRMLAGEAADPELLRALQGTAATLYTNARERAQQQTRQYRNLALRSGLRPSDVFAGLGLNMGYQARPGGIPGAPAASAGPRQGPGAPIMHRPGEPLPEGIPDPWQ